MLTLFGLCAVVGGTILVCQFLLTLAGLGGDHDVDAGGDLAASGGFEPADADVGAIHISEADVGDIADDVPGGGHGPGHATSRGGHGNEANAATHGSNWFFKVVTFRTIVAAVTFFGLAGLAANSSGASTSKTLAIAMAAGLAAMFAIHWVMQQLYELRADGTVVVHDALGHTGTVHVRIPGLHAGAGKLLINLHDRTMEFQARTAGDDIPSGQTVLVVRVLGPDTVEVERSG